MSGAANARREGAAQQSCFHCGLPVPAGEVFGYQAGDDWRSFCCAGCEAVARFIAGLGLDDYYRLRQERPARAEATREAAELSLYDEPTMQARFTRDAGGGAREADLILEGIRCSACAWLIEQVAGRVPGVTFADVNYAQRRARVRWREGDARLSDVFAAIGNAGYTAWPFEEAQLERVTQRERRAILRRFLVAALGMMQVMMYAVPAYIAAEGDIGADAGSLMRWAGLMLTTPVIAYSAAPFFRGAWRDLRLRRLGMDVPVALGLAVAFAASAVATWSGTGAVYFDSVAMFVFLLTGGRYLEHVALARARRSLQHLAALIPASAHRLRDAQELATELVPAAKLVPGDRVLVRSGEAAPADGVLASAEATVSEALLSGESRLLARHSGERVVGGAVNAGSPFVLRVTHVGPDTVLSALRRMMEAAASQRPRWVEAAERASGVFVAFILLTAAAAAFTWLAVDPSRALWVAVSVLIVTCPCALSLAMPVALSVATGAMARRNLVVTQGRAIEGLAHATDFVIDKTGTLTGGRPRLIDAVALGTLDVEACLAMAAAIGHGSSHPLDRALAEAAGARALPEIASRQLHPGLGAQACVAGMRVRLGRGDFAGALHARAQPIAWLGNADTLVWLADESQWLAVFRIGDALRPGAAAAVARLHARGIQVHLLTGDERNVAARVARELGIERVEARATPARKQAYVRALQLRGARVAMVGDGINDAPVLGQADVSIAMGGGADLAQVRADAVLVSDSLDDLAGAVDLARRARAVVRENLAWALAYNLVVIPLAFVGMVTPLIAGIGMASSSLLVIANALRLRA